MKNHFVEVLGSKIHYLEDGKGDPILFLHGMPTSSYLWRNIIPHLSPLGRCIAPDLIGMGKSDKPDIEYSIFDHIKYIDKFIEALNLKRVTLVLHGWGSVIGFDYAMRHENNCKGLVFYEAYLRPFNGNDISLPYQEQLMELEAEEDMYEITLDAATFVDKTIMQGLMGQMNEEDLFHYREPFLKEGSGKPLHQFLQEIPGGKNNVKVNKIIKDYSVKLTKSHLPKLLMYSIPGFITTIATVMWAKENLPNLEIVEVGEELHFAQESNPTLMGETISIWLQGIETMA